MKLLLHECDFSQKQVKELVYLTLKLNKLFTIITFFKLNTRGHVSYVSGVDKLSVQTDGLIKADDEINTSYCGYNSHH